MSITLMIPSPVKSYEYKTVSSIIFDDKIKLTRDTISITLTVTSPVNPFGHTASFH